MRICISAVFLLTMIFTTSAAQAQTPGGIDLVPGDVAFVVKLKALEETIEDLATFVDKVQPGFGGVVRTQGSAVGMAISNPTLGGVDKTRDLFIAAFANEQGPPDVVFVVPTANADDVKKAVGSDFDYAETDGWVAYSNAGDLINLTTECIAGDIPSVTKAMSDSDRKELNAGHLGVYVNGRSLKETYAGPLEELDETLNEFIDQMAVQIQKADASMDVDYIKSVYQKTGSLAIQGVRDSKSAVISLRITDTALQIDESLTVDAGSKTAGLLSGQPVSDLSLLTSIPEGMGGYWAMSGDPKPLMDWGVEMLDSTIADEDVMKKFRNSIDTMREVKFGTIAGGFDITEDEETAVRYAGIAELAPTQKIREAFRAFGPSAEYEIAGIQQELSFKADAEEIDGQSVDFYRFKQTIPEAMDPLGVQKAINDRLYGPDGMLQRLAFLEGRMLQTMGGEQELMRQLLKPGKWSNEQLIQARQRQHEKANVLLLGDLPNGILAFAKLLLATKTLPLPITVEQLEPLQIAPSYAGMSVTTEPDRLRVRTSLPVETFQGFAQIALFIQGMRAGSQ